MRVFDKCKGIPAIEVARRAGVQLEKHGRRYWAKCPLHGEKTASLCFYEDGRWYCFGCHSGGDAVSLYAALYRVSNYEAAKTLLSGYKYIPRRVDVRHNDRRNDSFSAVDEQGLSWTELCKIKHKAEEDMKNAVDDSSFMKAVVIKAEAELHLEIMQEDMEW